MTTSTLTRFQPPYRLTLAFSAALLSLASLSVQAAPAAPPALETFLKQHSTDAGEDVELHGSGQADLDRDGVPDTVVVWLLTGPTYWRNILTVLSPDAKSGYRERAALVLDGEADFKGITSDGLIQVQQKTYGADDPRCCPSRNQTLGYLLAGGQLLPAAH